MTPDVRVGIVSFETAHELRRCLSALPAALGDLVSEIVVVDNASKDGSQDVVASFPGVRLVVNPANVGYARAMNTALADSEAPFLLAVNPDTVPQPGSLERLVRVQQTDPAVGLSVPRLLNDDGTLQHSGHRFPSVELALVMGLVPHRLRRGRIGRRYWLEGYHDHSVPAEVDWAVGAVHCVRRAALGRPEPYSERWFMYAEDLEICWHVRRRGWKVRLEPSAVVTHSGNVAGDRTFGARRELRWIDAVYDWYVGERGAASARGFAVASTVGLLLKAAVLRVVRRRPDDQRSVAVEGLLRIHARRALDPRTTGLSLRPPG